ncbi:MAG TPA: Hsp20/alpha crystallin family protein [Thiotrichales bacterium]|nr:Hsp20/alpha crystallin family protein [Thiotrichales bacterium]
MSLVRYEPWSLLNQLSKEIDQLFDPRRMALSTEQQSDVATADWVPAVDIKEEPDKFVIHADVPGVDPKDIEVSMENGVLTIKGQREEEKKEEKEGYKRIERVRGAFYRRFSLPDTADAEKIRAKVKNGVLEIVIPKQEEVQPRRITVEAEES